MRIVIALLITLLVVALARFTSPSQPYEVETRAMGIVVSHEAPRYHAGEGPAEIELKVNLCKCLESDFIIDLVGRIKGEDTWERLPCQRVEPGDKDTIKRYIYSVSNKPLTTRYFYRFEGQPAGEEAGPHGPALLLGEEDGEPLMIKFKGVIPLWVLIPHVLAMFGGFFFLVLSSLNALPLIRGSCDEGSPARLAWRAWWLMFIGGIPLGFAMNYFAFNVYWEAYPFGSDVTDNKTQVALIIWGLAGLGLSFKKGRFAACFTVLAAALVLAIFLIPHSLQIS